MEQVVPALGGNRRLLVAACGGSDAADEALVRLDEFSVDAANVVAAGSSELVVRNDGEFGHTLVIADETGQVVVATDLIPPERGPSCPPTSSPVATSSAVGS